MSTSFPFGARLGRGAIDVVICSECERVGLLLHPSRDAKRLTTEFVRPLERQVAKPAKTYHADALSRPNCASPPSKLTHEEWGFLSSRSTILRRSEPVASII